MVSGVDVGRVTSITLTGDSVEVEARIDRSTILKEDAHATIVSHQLMDGKLIELHPGTSTVPLPENRVIRGTYVPGIMNLTQILYGRRQQIAQIITDLEMTTGHMRSLFSEATSDSNSLGVTLQNLVNLTNRLDSFFRDNAGMLRTTLTNLERSSIILNDFLASQDSTARKLLTEGRELTEQL